MTIEDIVKELKQENPTLKYGINDEVFVMSDEEYEATISSWAAARFAKLKAIEEKAAIEESKNAAISKLQDLGIDFDELKALGLG